MRVLNTYHVHPDLDSLGAAFLAVLAEHDDGGMSVYVGIVALPDTDAPTYWARRQMAAERVMRHGDHLRFERAVTYYPYIKQEEYH